MDNQFEQLPAEVRAKLQEAGVRFHTDEEMSVHNQPGEENSFGISHPEMFVSLEDCDYSPEFWVYVEEGDLCATLLNFEIFCDPTDTAAVLDFIKKAYEV